MRVLVVAPHCDDETIGMGGTMAWHASQGDEVVVAVMTGHGPGPHPLWPREVWEKIRAEGVRAFAILGVSDYIFRELPAVGVADQPLWAVNREAREVVESVAPDILYVPFPYDLHRDHREVFHAMSIAWRPSTRTGRAIQAVRAYEVPSETHWNAPYLEPGFLPNLWVDISPHLEAKLRALACYQSQIPPWPEARSSTAIEHLARYRGSQMGMEAAEAFVVVRELAGRAQPTATIRSA